MKLMDSNRFWLPGTDKKYIHLASVSHGVHEYLCFANAETNQVYIEEVTGGHLEFIEDDALAEEIQQFLIHHKVLLMARPLLSDDDWLRRGKTS